MNNLSKTVIDRFLELDLEVKKSFDAIEQLRKQMRELANAELPQYCPVVVASNQSEYEEQYYHPVYTHSHPRKLYLQKVEFENGKLVFHIGMGKFEEGSIRMDIENIVNIESVLQTLLEHIEKR